MSFLVNDHGHGGLMLNGWLMVSGHGRSWSMNEEPPV
jgi:hypothetical protein